MRKALNVLVLLAALSVGATAVPADDGCCSGGKCGTCCVSCTHCGSHGSSGSCCKK